MQNLQKRTGTDASIDSERSSFQIKDFKESIGQSDREFDRTVAQYQYKILWTYAANCILALCLITSPFIYDYKSPALAASDIISGALIILFECISFSPRRVLMRW